MFKSAPIDGSWQKQTLPLFSPMDVLISISLLEPEVHGAAKATGPSACENHATRPNQKPKSQRWKEGQRTNRQGQYSNTN